MHPPPMSRVLSAHVLFQILLPGWTGTKLVMRSPAVPTVIALLFLAELVAATQADYTAPDTGLFDTERWQAAARYLLTEAAGAAPVDS